MKDVGRDDIRMQGKPDTGQTQATDFLNHHGAVEEIGAHAAVLLRDMRTEHPGLTRLVPECAVDMPVFFPLGMKWHSLLFKELAHAVAKEFVIGAEQCSGDHDDT